MSGGSMDYVGFKIEQAAEYVAQEIARIEKMDAKKIADEFHPCNYYVKNYPDKKFLASPTGLRRETLKRLRAAEKAMRIAAIYAIRVEWLTSCDDGYDNFILQTDEELEKFKKRTKK